ncbi:hypothetical protein QTP70_034652 [Hemibagrus guttatus]|uniref:Orange domain-containing protein n=1 Tax=Hemibagrus guttatus TaxID=175788 RepID=A0AAE0V843_9TELE|nr:hypothetical protein QTP70_034652 [Hemibagrus guttatus]KAK3565682.1 hypothetical protein QTP86_014047 [Hemibagrus guttatus]
MVAASETLIKTKASGGKKIRKSKFEKADILELTVKHLKHLQNNEKGSYCSKKKKTTTFKRLRQLSAVNSAVTEYQAGFRTCIAGVHQYLLMSNANPALRSNALAHLSNALLCLSARLPDSSTADSDGSLKARAPASPRTDDMCLLNDVRASQNVKRKRTEISNKDKTTHKHIGVNRSCSATTNLHHNYWRPW